MSDNSLTLILKNSLNILLINKVKTALIGVIVLAGNYLAAIFFNGVEAIYQGHALSLELWPEISTVSILSFAPAGALGVIGFAFLLEANVLGWKKSSLKKALESKTTSIKTDWFYALLYASNIAVILGYLFTLGVGYHYSGKVKMALDISLLADANPGVGFLTLLLANSLTFYIFHRIAHTGFFWELHKSHHSADDLVIITNFRNHPLDIGIRSIFYAIPAAVLGVPPLVVIAYQLFSGFIVLMQHTPMDWNMPIIEKYFFIGSKGHRIHHSRSEEHNNKNLGYLVLWDWVFGTLCKTDDKIIIGIDDQEDLKHIHRTPNMARLLWGVYTEALQAFFAQCFVTLGLKKPAL